ncbi:hypothetical protein J6590_009891, partial [Homalodisca vitripennis]
MSDNFENYSMVCAMGKAVVKCVECSKDTRLGTMNKSKSMVYLCNLKKRSRASVMLQKASGCRKGAERRGADAETTIRGHGIAFA